MNDLKVLYILVVLPLRSSFKLLQLMLLVSLLAISCLYTLTFDIVMDSDLLTANYQDIKPIVQWSPKDNTKIYDEKGLLISEQFNEYHLYTPFKEIPQDMINAIIAIEDRKFWQHKGIDILGITRAALKLVQNQKYTQGASTITQQVVKNLLLTKEKTITRKLREIVLSLYIETILPKEKIMEIYCNQIFLGFGSYGVAAAAKRFFGKDLKQLNTKEMALIAGLFQLPGRYNPIKYPERAKRRQEEVLLAMADAGFLELEKAQMIAKEDLEYIEYESRSKLKAPYFIDYVVESAHSILEEQGYDLKDSGLKIYTSLDSTLQDIAEETISSSDDIYKFMHAHMIKDSKIENEDPKVEASILVLDRKTGQVKAMVGGRDYEDSQYNRTYQSLRAPGSVFKPITYSLALKKGKNWSDLYYVAPITIGNYRPRTERAKLFSETTLLEAFYKSVNSPAVALGNELGIKRVISHAKKLGIDTELKDEAAILLGSSEVTMFDIAKVYTTLSNRGTKVQASGITKIEDAQGKIIYEAKIEKKKVLDTKTAELINEGLKQVIRRGTGYKISYLGGYAAGKTGTSNKSRDNWFAGFTNDLVVVAWLGNDEQNSFSGTISAANTAAPLWGKFVNKSLKKLKTARLRGPSSLQKVRINRHYGHVDQSGIAMYFKPGQAPKKQYSDLMRINNGEKIRITLNDF